jgi:hypothetical protein
MKTAYEQKIDIIVKFLEQNSISDVVKTQFDNKSSLFNTQSLSTYDQALELLYLHGINCSDETLPLFQKLKSSDKLCERFVQAVLKKSFTP